MTVDKVIKDDAWRKTAQINRDFITKVERLLQSRQYAVTNKNKIKLLQSLQSNLVNMRHTLNEK